MRHATKAERRVLIQALRRWKGPSLPNGRARRKGFLPEAFDLEQLAIGTAIELEHTARPEIALEIATAHLNERGDYYELLEKVEREPRKRSR